MWAKKDGLSYKTMAYFNSCFPCSLHVILANLGYVRAEGDGIEDLWNGFHGDLNRTAPNEMQVHDYVRRTSELGGRGVLYTPLSFGAEADVRRVGERLRRDFVRATRPVGLIAGLGHAEVFFRTKRDAFFHFKPSPEMDGVVFERVTMGGMRVLEAPDGRGGIEYALGIEYRVDGAREEVHAAHFAMLVS